MISTAFESLVGQEQAIELLTQAIAQNRIAPAYLFAGPDGVGRSLAARCFIKLLFSTAIVGTSPSRQNRISQGNHPDLLWVQPTYLHNGARLSAAEAAEKGLKRSSPPQIRLEQVREIAQFLGRPPQSAPRNVVVLEQAETMAEAAANALLKTLEEPGRATLILIAPSESSLLPTLGSRCQKIGFSRLNSAVMARVLTQTGHEEILKWAAVVELASGSPGKAIALFQQQQAIPPDLLAAVTKQPKSLRNALELARAIDDKLDTEAQLWLVDYLQHCYWQQWHQPGILHQLEQTRKSLLCYAQPRLVWEWTLLAFCQASVS